MKVKHEWVTYLLTLLGHQPDTKYYALIARTCSAGGFTNANPYGTNVIIQTATSLS